ncbi:MAG: PilZ domain-containing protein [Terriglobia bacterium]
MALNPQDERQDRYAAAAAERLRAASDCQFSLLPHQELARTAAGWYEACAQGMLRSNFAPIDDWVGEHARLAADQGFELTDLLALLRLCRQTAIEKEGWNEDVFADVDAVIDEALARLRGQVSWAIPEGLNYLTGKSHADREKEKEEAAVPAETGGERRTHRRNKLRLPIRLRGLLSTGPLEETTRTENVAKGGLYFTSRNPYFLGQRLQVIYPYWDNPGAINDEYPAEVVRVAELSEKRKGVALKFLASLGRKDKRP